LRHPSQVRTRFLNVAVDAASFDHIEHSHHDYALQDTLIRLRTPLKTMRAFFGMNNADYAARRHVLGLAGTDIGRPHGATEEEERLIWEAWHLNGYRPPEQRYLRVGRATAIPLNTVWGRVLLAARWAICCHLPVMI